MEVHHHSHHGKKKWTEYFWEFLMLFLAVFAGFLAENQREHYVEKKREKQFILSIIRDLESDTLILSQTIAVQRESNKMIDTLITLLKSPDRSKFTGRIYFLAKSIPLGDVGLVTINKTYEQMKSSGNLRLIHDVSLVDTISYYYFIFDNSSQVGPGQMQFENRHDLFITFNKLFDASVFQKMISSENEIVTMPEYNPQLLTDDPAIINEVCMRYHNISFTRKVMNDRAEGRKELAKYLISKIQKEYHLN